MKRVITYRYDSWLEGCGCCSNSSTTFDVYEDGVLVSEDNWCEWASNEEELREILTDMEPFEVDEDNCRWF